MQVRLNKFLAQVGIASRREVDKMIVEGKIKVNGRVIKELGYKIDEVSDWIDIEGKRIKRKDGFIYILLNKPKGVLVTLKDPFRRPTVIQLLPKLGRRVFPVGRLDYDSEGLLLLTNDGEIAHRLAHPRFKIRRVYHVQVKGHPESSSISRLEKGIYLDDKKTGPTKMTCLSRGKKKSLFRVEIQEGRKREVRRMFAVIGHPVLQLKRISYGGVKMGKMKRGEWRFLTRDEISLLKKQVDLEER